MGTLILVRHGRSTANGKHVLAGRAPDVALDASGIEQATSLVARLDGREITTIVSSPIARCMSTVAPLATARAMTIHRDDRLTEVDYGDWTGRALTDLRRESSWSIVQRQPSAMTFPNGESMRAVASRAVAAARELAGASATTVVCSHGDVIGMILADALGMHLDLFQRIVVSPSAISIVHYTDERPMVECVNVLGAIPSAPSAPAIAVGGDPGDDKDAGQDDGRDAGHTGTQHGSRSVS